MSEFLAEARVLIRPDTTGFRALLQAELVAATRGVTVPVAVAPTATGTAGVAALTAQTQRAAVATSELAGVTRVKAAADREAAAAAAAHSRQLGQVRTAAIASGASMAGLRGAVLTAGGAFLGATVAIQAFGKAVQSAAELETNLNVFRVTAGATADEMERVREEAVALGRDIRLPAVSAGDAAEAITLLARAGLSVEDSLAGARGVLQLATAAQVDNAAATELAASALNAFALAGEDAVAVADLLANSANLSQGSITDMGIALRQSAGAAAQIGLSLEDTVTVLTALARTGLAGSDAGTTLRVALLRLVAPTKDAQKALERFNIDLRDTAGNVRVEALFELEEALRGVSEAEADRARVAIFGQNAFRVSALLGRQSVQDFQDLEEAVTRQGAAAELARARTQGFAGSLEALRSNLETLGTTLGTVALPPLGAFVTSINDLVTTLNTAAEGFRTFQREASRLNSTFEDLVPGGERVSDVIRTIGKDLLGPQAGFVFTARQVNRLVGAFSDGAKEIEGDASAIEENVRRLFSVFQQQGGLGSATALNEFVLALDEIADRLAKGDAEAQKTARSIRELIKELQTPTDFRLDLNLDLDQSEINDSVAKATDSVTEGFRRAGGAISEVGLQWLRDLGNAIEGPAERVGRDMGEAVVKGFNDAQIQGQLQAQKTAVAQAQAFGETGLEELLAERARIDRILQSDRRPVGPALEALLQERKSVIDQIARINEEEANAKEEAADRIQRSQDAADEKFFQALSGREDRLQNAAIVAESTENLRDDLRAQIALRNFFRDSISEIRKTVRDAQARAQAVRAATADLIRAQIEVDQAREDLRQALRDERREQRERQRERLDLAVQIAQATGNRAAEIRARENEIDQIKEDIRQTRRGSLQRKRLILELRQAQRDLRELQKETQKTGEEGQSFRELTFDFLQKQQGFAANLLGNLIPGGATGGLVGNISPAGGLAAPGITPGAAVQQEAAVAAGRDLGFSRGQGNETNTLLRQILASINALNGRAAAPEARYQRAQQSAFMDVIGT